MSSNQLILICDDQHIIHETLGAYLMNEGFECASAYDDTRYNDAEKERYGRLPRDTPDEPRSHNNADRQIRGDRPRVGP